MNNSISLIDIYNAINDFRDEVRGTYATKEEVAPIKATVYGLVSLLLTAVVVALVAGVVKAR